MTPEEAADLILKRNAARTDIVEFAKYIAIEPEPAPHHELVLKQLQRVVDGDLRRLMVFMPPGCAKSTYCSVIMPAFYMGKHPDRQVIAASYDTTLATKFAGRVKQLVSTEPNYQTLFPGMGLSADTKAKGEWNLDGKKGGYYATGVGSAITGRRGHLAILDDLVKDRQEADSVRVMDSTWEWLLSALQTRLIPQTNAIVYITTRWSQNDPAGRLLPEDWDGQSGPVECRDGAVWEVVSLPAEAVENDPLGRKVGEWLWPEWYTPEEWVSIKKIQTESGTRNWSSLYQQNPTPEEGTYFKREWFKFYDTPPSSYTSYVAADFAVSEDRGDFTEIGVFGVDKEDNLYVAPDGGWWSGKTAPDIWIERLLDFVALYKPHTFLSEKGVIRNSVEPFLDKRMDERRVYVTKEWLPHIGDKTANARAFQARAHVGKVYLPNDELGHRILTQLLNFPAGKHDDVIDVCGFIGRWLQMSTVPSVKQKSNKIYDRWERAFRRNDMNQDNGWKVA